MPFIFHVPEMVFPVAMPVRVMVLPAGVPEFTTNPKVPFTLPLRSPLNLNAGGFAGHARPVTGRVKFGMLSDPSPFHHQRRAK